MNRRTFFSQIMTITGAVALASIWKPAKAERSRGGSGDKSGTDGAKLVDPNSSQAKAVNYTDNKATITSASLKADRQGVSFDKQKCQNCGFYSKPQGSGANEVGSCQIFAGLNVKAEAWCASWNKKS